MRCILLRHGKTAGNLEGRYAGRTDDSLCDEGIRELSLAGSFPNVAQVYVSPMKRTLQTAGVLFPRATVQAIEGLREMDFGVFENKNFEELKDDPAYRQWVEGGCVSAAPEGEALSDVEERAAGAFLQHIMPHAALHRIDPIVIVAHGGSIMALMHRFAEKRGDSFEWHCPNGGGWRLDFSPPLSDGTPVFRNIVRIQNAKELHL